MNKFPVPLRFVATVLLSGILVLIGIVNLRDRAAWMDPTDGVFWTESEGGLKAAAIDPGGPGSHAGIRKGDRLISINGKAVSRILGEYSSLIYRANPGTFLGLRADEWNGKSQRYGSAWIEIVFGGQGQASRPFGVSPSWSRHLCACSRPAVAPRIPFLSRLSDCLCRLSLQLYAQNWALSTGGCTDSLFLAFYSACRLFLFISAFVFRWIAAAGGRWHSVAVRCRRCFWA